MNRIFLVGCSRSGTSIIQKELVKKLNIWSLPETSFLIYSHETLEDRLTNIKRLLKTASINIDNNDKYSLWQRSAEIVGEESTFRYLIKDISPLQYLTLVLDNIAKNSGYKSWIEKSPTHYQSSKEILDMSTNNWVIFVLRNGLDVVGSIRDRAIKNPKLFSNQYRLEYGLNLWNDSVKTAKNNMLDERFLVISYEEFCKNPDKTLTSIKNKIDIELNTNENTSINTIGKGEIWKNNVTESVRKSKPKLHLFSDDEITNLKQNLKLKQAIQLLKMGNIL